jgi:hypothetical protein
MVLRQLALDDADLCNLMFSRAVCPHSALDQLTEHHQLLFKLGTLELVQLNQTRCLIAASKEESPVRTKAMCLRSRLAQQLGVFLHTYFMRPASQTSALIRGGDSTTCAAVVGSR